MNVFDEKPAAIWQDVMLACFISISTCICLEPCSNSLAILRIHPPCALYTSCENTAVITSNCH